MSFFDIFSRKVSLSESGICQGLVDCHAHLLPGVDDGIQTLEDSLAVLAQYEALGFRELYCTPHIMEDCPNETERLKERFAQFAESYKGGIKLRLAAEYMVDRILFDRLSAKDLLPHGPSEDHLLIETSFYAAPTFFHQAVDQVKAIGFWPILAHPERYGYMDIRGYESLKTKGVKFQLNIPSLLGKYGEDASEKAQMLLNKGMYDFLGTDVHRFDSNFPNRKLAIKEADKIKSLK